LKGGRTHVFDFDNNIFGNNDIQDFFDAVSEKHQLDLREKNCQWMIVDELKIEIH